MIIKIIVTTLLFIAHWTNGSYDRYQVIEMNLKTSQEMNFIFKLAEECQADIWTGPSMITVTHIMVSPENLDRFLKELESAQIDYKIIIKNVQEHIDEVDEDNKNFKFGANSYRYGPVINDHFPTYEEIVKWIDYLISRYSIVSTGSYGKSYEGRDLKYIKISTGPNRKAILLDGGIHGREWLAVSTVTYIVEKMINEYSAGSHEITSLLSKYDFYFIPVINPDGYAFTHTYGNRLWRKNRKPFRSFGRICYGVDLNRNFDVDFGGSSTSSNPCDDLYRGQYAFSEPETEYFTDFAKSIRKNLALYMSLHSYAQFWFVPYGYSRRSPPDNLEVRRVANIGNMALYKTNGVRFEVGTPPELLYTASGGAFDWIKEKLGVKYSYTLELRPSRSTTTGTKGFIAPVTDIEGSGEEVYAALLATAKGMVN